MKRSPLNRRQYLTPRQKLAVMKRQGFKCACGCNEPLGDDPRDINFDHRCPLWAGGTNDLDNFAALRKKHHLTKTVKEAKARAKADRLAKDGGRRKMTAGERELARLMGN